MVHCTNNSASALLPWPVIMIFYRLPVGQPFAHRTAGADARQIDPELHDRLGDLGRDADRTIVVPSKRASATVRSR
jgi:hypothetical protein